MRKTLDWHIPEPILNVTKTLEKADFEAYIVGGCVRDLLIGKKPKDWDVTTNATPEQIIALFPKTFYENTYGTVGVVNEDLPMGEDGVADETLRVVEVTPYRVESTYSDNRRPDSVTFSTNIHDDLKRRDFTINAIALKAGISHETLQEGIIDPFNGLGDIENKIIKTVGKPEDRFGEDALRIIRAVRIATDINFTIEKETGEGIKKCAPLLEKIAIERIRDEFVKILMSDRPMDGIIMAHTMGILKYIAPELEKAIGVGQNQAHSFDVWTHLLKSLQHAADKKWPLDIRLAAVFHDISKPETKRIPGPKMQPTFYGHEVVGARVAKKILERLKFPTKLIEKVTTLIRWHMFFSDTEQITLSAVRRMIVNVGKENIWDLMNLRICDRIGTGRPKEDPYRLRRYHAMIDEAMHDPISVGMLKINGTRIIEVTKTPPGPKIGFILSALLEEVLNDPTLNTTEYLEKKSQELILLSEKELKALGEKGIEKKEELENLELKKIRRKHKVN